MFEVEVEYHPRVLAFGNEILPMLADILRKEIEGGQDESKRSNNTMQQHAM
ncbi:MAG: hypothetical protein ACFFDF_08665 [Candidatus Odinarchaeota archaeon]